MEHETDRALGDLMEGLFFFITFGLELSDTQVYEPYIRALLGTRMEHETDRALGDLT